MGMTIDGFSYWQAETEGVDLINMTIGDLLDQQADALPTQEAIVYANYPEFGGALNVRCTYRDYRDRAHAVARGLLALGENLFPAEIEEFLIRHPKVAQVQVVGVPDAYFGEELLAVVIPEAGQQLTEEDLRVYCQGQISHQKIPRYVQFVESFPLTASGKVQKFVLREQAIKAFGLEEIEKIKTALHWVDWPSKTERHRIS